ncbi:MAG: low molecular weight protein arginine phosphatase [Acidobacteria bacterium]|nr:low molecular weight protein arginine phosphatase [Acidobacteriota bacterium]
MRILFVCTGNVCRSPLAEAYFRRFAPFYGLSSVEVASAGISPLEGQGVEEEGRRLSQEMGFDLSNHRARQLSEELIKDADLVLVMERGQRELLSSLFPQYRDRVKLLSSFARDGAANPDIPDAYQGTLDEYRETFRRIKEAVDGLFRFLSLAHKRKPDG